MKKLCTLIVVMLFLMTNVNALNNKLYFTEKDDRLYYDSDSFDKSIFMQHLDMIPGRTYVDEITIENKTRTKYTLYLKAVNVEQTELADELIDNIEMLIYLDDVLIYEGYARGLDYHNIGVNLQDAILIGEYPRNKESKLTVYTKLANEYGNINNDSIGKIDWEFYASYDKKVVPVLPDTSDNISKYIVLLVCSSLLFVFLILFISKRKDKKELN